MKLIIQIPCYNEAEVIAETVAALPRSVEGFDAVEWLVIDDGSSDGTGEAARAAGVDHVVRHVHNQGLARAFMTGLDTSIRLGADVIVNTDADNQYDAGGIPAITAPLVDGTAEMVIGVRPVHTNDEFSAVKKLLNRFGSFVVGRASGTGVADAPSGFRAFSRRAAQRLMVFGDYTYTLETIIQAGQSNIAVATVPVETNPATRPSRLVRSIPSYVLRSMATIVRIFVIYRPFRFFCAWGALLFGTGFLIGLRFLGLWFGGEGQGHVQSLVLAGALLGMGFQCFLIAFVADLLAANRKLLMDMRYRVSRLEDSVLPTRDAGRGDD